MALRRRRLAVGDVGLIPAILLADVACIGAAVLALAWLFGG
jgi:hypothetical protein